MKPALDASRALTVALTAAQDDTLKQLDRIASACADQMTHIREDRKALMTAIDERTAARIDALNRIREDALALAAEVRDGNDDMARAMSSVFSARLTIAPPDAETSALAARLAPPVREAAE